MLAALLPSRWRKQQEVTVAPHSGTGAPRRVQPPSAPSSSSANLQAQSLPGRPRKPAPTVRQLSRRLTKQDLAAKSAPPTVSRQSASEETKTVNMLVSDMRSHMNEMREIQAGANSQLERLKLSEEELQQALLTSQHTVDQLQQFNEEMDGDFVLMKKQPVYGAAVDRFLAAALGENPEVKVSSAALYDYLCECLALGEPDLQPSTTAAVSWHPSVSAASLDPTARDTLKVFHSSGAAELQKGSNVRDNATSEAAQAVWRVLRTGEPELANPHGLARVGADARSYAPLKSTAGQTFGVLASGPPAVPDCLLEALAKQAGPLLELVWKEEKAAEAVANIVNFIKSAATQERQLVFVRFIEGATPPLESNVDPWRWGPLKGHKLLEKKYSHYLGWSRGHPIGELTVTCGQFTSMDEKLIMLLCAATSMLQRAIEVIEEMTPGDVHPLTSNASVLGEYTAIRPEVSTLLEEQMRMQLATFRHEIFFPEIASYDEKAITVAQRRVLQGVLSLLGYPRKSIESWKGIQKKLHKSRALYDAMCALQLHDESPRAVGRWRECEAILKGLNVDDVARGSSVPIQVRWRGRAGAGGVSPIRHRNAPPQYATARRPHNTPPQGAPTIRHRKAPPDAP